MEKSLIQSYVDYRLDKEKTKSEVRREKLDSVYQRLKLILDHYPNHSPNNCLTSIEDAPYYSLEGFDSIIKSLNYKLDHYKSKYGDDAPSSIKEQISNIEDAINKISDISEKYFTAKRQYQEFKDSEDKAIFDLYASEQVKESLAEFEITIENTFVSCNPVEDGLIDFTRNKVLESFQRDLGV